MAQTIHVLYPTTQELEDMSVSFHDEPQSCLGACEPFGSALFLVESGSEFNDRSTLDHRFDHKGHSVTLRVAIYMCDLMQATMISLTANKAAEVLVFLCIVQQCLRSQIVSGHTKGLYNQSCSHVEIFDARLHDLLFKVAENSTDWRRNSKEDVSGHDTTSILDTLLRTLLEQSRDTTSLAFHSGLSLSHILSMIVSCRGPNFECTETQLENLSKEFDRPFTTLAILSGFGQALQSSTSLKKFFKTLIGMFRDFEFGPLDSKNIGPAFRTLCLLNAGLAVYGEEDIPSHTVQLIHAVKKILSWIDGEDFSQKNFAVASEACRALTRILPALKLSIGSFWSETLTKLCLAPWTMYRPNPPIGQAFKAPSGSELFVLCSWSVKLYSRLARLKDIEDEEAFSIKDAFSDDNMQMNLNRGLLGLLEHLPMDTPVDTPFDRPAFNILHESMRPEILKVPIEDIDLGRIYPLLDSYVPATQAIAFETLSRALPRLIEDLTLEVVLNKQGIYFPLPYQYVI
jgi:hypothetical protein